MILPYFLRLLCLCFASFFVLNFLAGLLVFISSKSAIRFAESRTARAASRFLFAVRMLPFALATLFVVGLCVPSYLWLEPSATAERVGLLFVVLGFLGAATWSASITRTVLALFASRRHSQLCRSLGQQTRISGKSDQVLLVENEAPLLALSGLLRPQLLISSSVFRNLSAEELDAALSHEHAHRTSRDNAKRLLLLMAPDIFPFIRPLQSLERNWSKLAEWAADDQATSGDSRRALSLATALVHVARMGSAQRLPYLSTSLLACDRELSARVDRLLNPAPVTPGLARTTKHRFPTTGLLAAACLAALLLAPSALASVHELLELLLH